MILTLHDIDINRHISGREKYNFVIPDLFRNPKIFHTD